MFITSRHIGRHFVRPSRATPLAGCRTFSSQGGTQDPPQVVAPSPLPPRKKVTVIELMDMKRKNKPITMVTAYDYPSAVHVDLAGIDMLLVGDSLGMVELGQQNTLSVTMDDIVHHSQAVVRAVKRPFIVGDMPFGSYEISPEQGLGNAIRLMKEGGVDAVKIEGGSRQAATATKITQGGIACMGHIGLTPQSISVLGGFRAQGRTAAKAVNLIEDAIALEKAGCFALVIECVPPNVAKAITERVSIPTIGIGAGRHTSGQVLVFHDLLGMLQHPHHAEFMPKFCKQYASVGATIHDGLMAYKDDVESSQFPSDKYSPYKMSAAETEMFEAELEKRGVEVSQAEEVDDSDTIKVY